MSETKPDWQQEILRAVVEKMEFITQNREKLLEAWVAETGLLPSESVLITEEEFRDNVMRMTCWVEPRKESTDE